MGVIREYSRQKRDNKHNKYVSYIDKVMSSMGEIEQEGEWRGGETTGSILFIYLQGQLVGF